MEMNEPLLSVIVPVYNIEDYIGECVQSLIGQTYRNMEIILVDDGSTDRSGDVCDDYATKEDRIVVVHKTNGGVNSARNAALNVAKGKYLTFVDGDDKILKDTFGLNIQILESDPSIDFVQFPLKRVDVVTSSILEELTYHDITIVGKFDLMLNYINGRKINCSLGSKIFRRDIFDFRLNEDLVISEDGYHCVDIVMRIDKAFLSDKGLYVYQSRDNSAVNSPFTDKKLKDMAVSKAYQLDYFHLFRQPSCAYVIAFLDGYRYLLYLLIRNNSYKAEEYLVRQYRKFVHHESMGIKNLLSCKIALKDKIKILVLKTFGERLFRWLYVSFVIKKLNFVK